MKNPGDLFSAPPYGGGTAPVVLRTCYDFSFLADLAELERMDHGGQFSVGPGSPTPTTDQPAICRASPWRRTRGSFAISDHERMHLFLREDTPFSGYCSNTVTLESTDPRRVTS